MSDNSLFLSPTLSISLSSGCGFLSTKKKKKKLIFLSCELLFLEILIVKSGFILIQGLGHEFGTVAVC